MADIQSSAKGGDKKKPPSRKLQTAASTRLHRFRASSIAVSPQDKEKDVVKERPLKTGSDITSEGTETVQRKVTLTNPKKSLLQKGSRRSSLTGSLDPNKSSRHSQTSSTSRTSTSWQSIDEENSENKSLNSTDLIAAMKSKPSGLQIKDRTYRFSMYKNCFVASELVDWLIETKRCSTREQGVQVGHNLLKENKIKYIKKQAKPFRDDAMLFTFVQEGDDQITNSEKVEFHVLNTLSSYVPQTLLQDIADSPQPQELPESKNFLASVMFADVSGYTALTERLAKLGPDGAEQLTVVLNRYFSKLINLIHSHGGDVVKFAGDALIAIWPCGVYQSDDEPLETKALYAVKCANQVREELHNYETAEGSRLSIHVGIGAGTVTSVIVGGVRKRWEYLLLGIGQATDAANAAGPGQVFVSQPVYQMTRKVCKYRGTKANNALMRLKSVSSEVTPHVSDRVKLTKEMETRMRAFIPGPVLYALREAMPDWWLAQLRKISVLFVNLPAIDASRADVLNKMDNAMKAIQTETYFWEGSVNKLLQDDKGITVIVATGIPPLFHDDDAVRAIKLSLGLVRTLREIGLICCIGISTGIVYCGSCGTDIRHEYALLGDTCNLAARLMQLAITNSNKKRSFIIADEATYEHGKNIMKWTVMTPVKLKGKAEPVAIFCPENKHDNLPSATGNQQDENNESQYLTRAQISKPSGSDGTMVSSTITANTSSSITSSIMNTRELSTTIVGLEVEIEMLQLRLDKFINEKQQKGLLIIEAKPGMGKDAMLDIVKERTQPIITFGKEDHQFLTQQHLHYHHHLHHNTHSKANQPSPTPVIPTPPPPPPPSLLLPQHLSTTPTSSPRLKVSPTDRSLGSKLLNLSSKISNLEFVQSEKSDQNTTLSTSASISISTLTTNKAPSISPSSSFESSTPDNLISGSSSPTPSSSIPSLSLSGLNSTPRSEAENLSITSPSLSSPIPSPSLPSPTPSLSSSSSSSSNILTRTSSSDSPTTYSSSTQGRSSSLLVNGTETPNPMISQIKTKSNSVIIQGSSSLSSIAPTPTSPLATISNSASEMGITNLEQSIIKSTLTMNQLSGDLSSSSLPSLHSPSLSPSTSKTKLSPSPPRISGNSRSSPSPSPSTSASPASIRNIHRRSGRTSSSPDTKLNYLQEGTKRHWSTGNPIDTPTSSVDLNEYNSDSESIFNDEIRNDDLSVQDLGLSSTTDPDADIPLGDDQDFEDDLDEWNSKREGKSKEPEVPLLIETTAQEIHHMTPYFCMREVFRQLFQIEDPDLSCTTKQYKDKVIQKIKDWSLDVKILEKISLLNDIILSDFEESSSVKSLSGAVRAERGRMLVVDLLDKSYQGKMKILVIHDAQWLEERSWELLWDVTQSCSSVFIVLSINPTVTKLPCTYRELVNLPETLEIKVEKMSHANTFELLCNSLGVDAIPEQLVEKIVDWTKGNPRSISEIAIYLEQNAVVQMDGNRLQLLVPIDQIIFPPTLSDVIKSRFEKLSPVEQLTCKAASIIGTEFSLEILIGIHPAADSSEENILKLLKVLESRKFIKQTEFKNRFSFRNQLVHQVVYESVLTQHKKALHQSVAEWHENNYVQNRTSYYTIITHHYTQADNLSKMIEYLEKSGKIAISQYSMKIASTIFLKLLDLPQKYGEQVCTVIQLQKWHRLLSDCYFHQNDILSMKNHVEKALLLVGKARLEKYNHLNKVIQFLEKHVSPNLSIDDLRGSERDRALDQWEWEELQVYQSLAFINWYVGDNSAALEACAVSLELIQICNLYNENSVLIYSITASILGRFTYPSMSQHFFEVAESKVYTVLTKYKSSMINAEYCFCSGLWDESQNLLSDLNKNSIGSSEDIQFIQLQYSLVHYHQGRFDDCLKLSLEVTRVSVKIKTPLIEIYGRIVCSMTYLATNRHMNAIRLLEGVLNIDKLKKGSGVPILRQMISPFFSNHSGNEWSSDVTHHADFIAYSLLALAYIRKGDYELSYNIVVSLCIKLMPSSTNSFLVCEGYSAMLETVLHLSQFYDPTLPSPPFPLDSISNSSFNDLKTFPQEKKTSDKKIHQLELSNSKLKLKQLKETTSSLLKIMTKLSETIPIFRSRVEFLKGILRCNEESRDDAEKAWKVGAEWAVKYGLLYDEGRLYCYLAMYSKTNSKMWLRWAITILVSSIGSSFEYELLTHKLQISPATVKTVLVPCQFSPCHATPPEPKISQHRATHDSHTTPLSQNELPEENDDFDPPTESAID